MVRLITLFVFLNACDLGITQVAECSSFDVGEANPLLQMVIIAGGWGAAWSYKIGLSLALGCFVWAAFHEPKRTRIMRVLNWSFVAIIIFNLVVTAYGSLS